MHNVIRAHYRIETPRSLEQAAEMIAGEQSSGTFLPVPGETEELKARSRARVISIEPLPSSEIPSLPGSTPARDQSGPITYKRANITIDFPFDNIGTNIPTLAATVCGNLFELRDHSGCKLIDLELPEVFKDRYPGPKFGIEGTRKLTAVYDRPVIGTIIKPSVGLSPDQTAAMVKELAEANIDFVKDDELMADPPHSPIKERVRCVMETINRVADLTGKKVMYAVNISDEIDAMKRHHDVVQKAEGNCVMISLNHVGFAGATALRQHSQLPIHGHRNGWGLYTRHPFLGLEFPAYQKLWRTVGIDHLHVNGLRNKFWEPDESVVQSIEAMKQPLFGGYQAMPVISSGQWGGQAPDTYKLTRTLDVMYVAGGGIMAHPGGPANGVKAIRQAWEAAVKGLDLAVYARDHLPLKQAMEKFGS